MKQARISVLCAGVASMLMWIFLVLLQMNTHYVPFVWGLGGRPLVGILGAVSIFLIGIYLNLLLWKWKKWESGRCAPLPALVIDLLLLAICAGSLVMGFMTKPAYYSFPSADQAKEIIVEEQVLHNAGFGGVYERMGSVYMVQIGEYSTANGFRPFESRCYSISWLEDGLTLRYYSGHKDEYKEERMYYQ